MNEELVNSAVSFLQDPNVASSPINKKVEFLQTKGLNDQEIDEAIKRANGAANTGAAQPDTPMTYKDAMHSSTAPLDYYAMAPAVPERTWKDYFIMATATAGVTYGFYQVVTRYLIPSIMPPGQTRVDEDKQAIDEEFLKIDKVLEQMAAEQQEMRDANTAKLADIDVVIDNVNDFLAKYNKDKIKFDDDLRLMKLEVDNLQNSIEKNMKLTKENIRDELAEILDELVSLKNLVKARAGAGQPDRKVAPVSLIPSALEILKKVKSRPDADAPPERPAVSFETRRASSGPDAVEGNIRAAGIPDWQLSHKAKEEQEAKIPAWQQNGGDGSGADKDAGSADVVKDSILKVGVPAWQLSGN